VFQVDLQPTINVLTIIVDMSILIGIPGAFLSWMWNQQRKAYDALDQRYSDWCKLQIEHPDFFEKMIIESNPNDMRRDGMCSQLSSLFEQAFFYFRGFRGKFSSKSHKEEWIRYLKYCLTPTSEDSDFKHDFFEYWRAEVQRPGDQSNYDQYFVKYIRDNYYSTTQETQSGEQHPASV